MNTDKIEQLAIHLGEIHRDQPDSFDMEGFVHPCGTPACIAGHCVHYFEPETFKKLVETGEDDLMDLEAARILELTPAESDDLFMPVAHTKGVSLSGCIKVYTCDAAYAAHVLRHAAKHNEVNWSPTVDEENVKDLAKTLTK